MSRMDPSMWDKIAFWAIVGITLILLASSMASMQGCATPPSTAPYTGACLVDKEGRWFCKDAQGIQYSPTNDHNYVCHTEDDWSVQMKYCKKEPK